MDVTYRLTTDGFAIATVPLGDASLARNTNSVGLTTAMGEIPRFPVGLIRALHISNQIL